MKEAIIKLINKWACSHDWVLDREIEIKDWGVTAHWKFLYKCKKCGKFKIVKT